MNFFESQALGNSDTFPISFAGLNGGSSGCASAGGCVATDAAVTLTGCGEQHAERVQPIADHSPPSAPAENRPPANTHRHRRTTTSAIRSHRDILRESNTTCTKSIGTSCSNPRSCGSLELPESFANGAVSGHSTTTSVNLHLMQCPFGVLHVGEGLAWTRCDDAPPLDARGNHMSNLATTRGWTKR